MLEPDKILQENPGSVIFSQYAEKLAHEGRLEEAVEILKKGIQANPYHAPGYSVLAEILFQLESEEEAVENLLSSIQLDPQMPRDLFHLGAYLRESEPEKGEVYFQSARQYEPVEDEAVLIEESFPYSRSAGVVKSAGSLPEEGNAEAGKENIPAEDSVTAEFDRILFGDNEKKTPAREEGSGEMDRGGEEAVMPVAGDSEQDQFSLEKDGSLPISFETGEEDGDKGEASDISAGQGLDENLDFSDVVKGNRKGPDETDDLGDIFNILKKEEPAQISETEEDTVSGIIDSFGTGTEEKSTADKEPEEPSAAEEYGEYQPPVIEDKEVEGVNVLEINEDEEYNLANFGFETSSEEDIPVLSEEERFELMSFAGTEEVRPETSPDTDDEPEVLPREHIEEPEMDSGLNVENGFGDYLSDEEIDILSASVSEVDDREAELAEGEDLDDILSVWTPPVESDEEVSIPEDEFPELEKEESREADSAADENIQKIAETGEMEEFPIIADDTKKESLTEEEHTLIRDFLADDSSFPGSEEGMPGLAASPPIRAEGIEDAVTAPGNEARPGKNKFGDTALNNSINANMPFYGYHLWFTESTSPAAPPLDAGAPSETEEKEDESLEDLISAYQNVLGSPEMNCGGPELTINGPQSEPIPMPSPEEAKPRSTGKGGSYTATMAEIYASQGLLSKAIEIYEILNGNNPGNEKFHARLAELKQIREHQTDAS